MVVVEVEKFRNLSQNKRRERITEKFGLTSDEIGYLKNGGLDLESADKLIENSIGLYNLPLGVATNFRINGVDYLIPMAVEEPSIIAAASKSAKIFKEFGGIRASSDEPIATGQIQLILRREQSVSEVINVIEEHKDQIIRTANTYIPNLIKRGGGVKDIESRIIWEGRKSRPLVLDIFIDTRDAMGANITNTVCENIAPLISELTDSRVGLKILTNFSDKRMAKAEVSIGLPLEVARRIVEAQEFAENDIYRAATHNKGVFNGIDAIAIATGNDWRGIEAGGHAYAARSGKYSPLTEWKLDGMKLNGKLELPVQVGTVGGLTELHPVAKTCLKILGVTSSKELAEIMAAVGL
ncbi:MAG TPA: hydroxymethylglutaryl-CoA reductase, degradative, partial [Patescibacteria group bacterium]|nr:hydroxymethylglutaryl-CoA reductase, degradative [Patescibacteria group bacterium]